MNKKHIPDHVPPLRERQDYIISRRLEGASADTLAQELGISKECVCKSIRALPSRSCAEARSACRNMHIDSGIIKEVCMKYLDGSTEEALMHEYEITEDELYDCFYAVTDRVAAYTVKGKKYPYPSVEKARHRLNMSLWQLLNAVEDAGYQGGKNFNAFTSIVRGWEFLPYSVAATVSEMLSLPISDICADVLDLKLTDTSKGASSSKELAASHFLALAESENKTVEQEEALAWALYRARKDLGVIF